MFEQFEKRVVPVVDVQFGAGTLNILGDGGSDSVAVLTIGGLPAPNDVFTFVTVNGATAFAQMIPNATNVNILMGGGADTVNLSSMDDLTGTRFVFGDAALGRPVAGTPETIKALTRRQIAGY